MFGGGGDDEAAPDAKPDKFAEPPFEVDLFLGLACDTLDAIPHDSTAIVPALEVVKARFAVVVIAAVTQGVDVPDEGGIRGLFAVSTMHGIVAPRAVGAAAQRDYSRQQ